MRSPGSGTALLGSRLIASSLGGDGLWLDEAELDRGKEVAKQM